MVRVPDLHGPVSRGGDEALAVVRVPPNLIHGQLVAVVSLLVRPGVSRGAAVDVPFFSSHDEDELVELVKIETKTSSKGN